MRVLVAGAGFANKGAEAMARTVRTELGRRIPGVELLLWDCPQTQRHAAMRAHMTPLARPALAGRSAKFLWSTRQAVARGALTAADLRDPTMLWNRQSAIPMLQEAGAFDAFVDISGFAYGDAWGPGPARSVGPAVARARELGAPVVFLPQAWGGFQRAETADAVMELLGDERTLLFARDERSESHLVAAGIRADRVSTRSDIVFAFDEGTAEDGEAHLRAMGCPSGDGPVVGIAPNMRVYERTPGAGEDNVHVRALAHLAAHCVDRLGAHVVLLPSECAPVDRGDDDRRLCSMVSALSGRPGRCHTSAAWVSAATARAAIGRCDYVVASRFHALVFALSQSVPCTAVGWSHKYAELMTSFGAIADHVGSDDLDGPDLIERFESGWRRRAERASAETEVATRLRDDVATLFDEVARYLREGARVRA